MILGEKITHPSFAMASFIRFHGGKGEFFGSPVRTNDGGVVLEIHSASIERTGHGDTYMPGKLLMSVEMSHLQFADLITNMNTTGTPVTLKKMNGERIEDPPFESKREIYDNQFQKAMQSITDKMDKLTEHTQDILNQKKAPTKGDKEQILSEIDNLKRIINDHIPYMKTVFAEEMDKVSLVAKSEFAAYVQSALRQMGLENVNDLRLLAENNKK